MYKPILHKSEYLNQYCTATYIQANITQQTIYKQVLQDN